MDDSQVFAYVTASVADWLLSATATGSQTIGSMYAVNAFDPDYESGSAMAWIDVTPVSRGQRISPGGGNYIEGKAGGISAGPQRAWIRRPLFHVSALARWDPLDPFNGRLRRLADAIENAFSRRFSIPLKEFSDPSDPTLVAGNKLKIRSLIPVEENGARGQDGGLRGTRFELELEYLRFI